MLPQAVMQQVQESLCNFKGLGVSVMEISHRSSVFLDLAQESTLGYVSCFRSLKIIRFYLCKAVLGAICSYPSKLSSHRWFSLLSELRVLVKKSAAEQAQQFVRVQRQDIKEKNAQGQWYLNTPSSLETDAAYVHLCSNETIEGLRLDKLPQTNVPLIADMSSCLLSEPVNVSDYGLIYACAPKEYWTCGLNNCHRP